MIKKTIKIISVIAMLISMAFTLSVFASADSTGFVLIPVAASDSVAAVRDGLYIGTRVSGSNRYDTWFAMPTAATVPAYACNVAGTVYCFSAVPQSIYRAEPTGNNLAYVSGTWHIESDTCHYIAYTMSGLVPSESLPYYQTISMAVSAWEAASPTTTELTFDLPCGNVAYISVPSSTVTVTLKETMPFLSAIVGSSWVEINQTRGTSSTMPSIGDTISVDALTKIPWMIDASGNKNWLGQSYSAVYSYSHTSGGYIVIYNPSVYAESNTAGSVSVSENNSISVTVSSASYVRIYSTDDDGTIFGTTSTLGSWTSKSSDDDFSSWTDSEGGNTPPNVGGDNVLPSEIGIKGILSQLVDDIKSIFEVAWKPIQDILQTVGGYFEKLADLWSWLPTEVSSLLVAGLTVIVAVGVLKSFL